MIDLIDWRIIERQDIPYLVEIRFDSDVNPETDGDWATPDQIDAWRRDEWCYVIVTVSTDPNHRASVGAVVWGDLPHAETPCGWPYVEDHLLSDPISELKGL